VASVSWNGVTCLTLECFGRTVVAAGASGRVIGMEFPLLQGAMSSVIIRLICSAILDQGLQHTPCEICQNYQAMLTTEPLDTANIINDYSLIHSLRLPDEQ
jgi:hypothetical protein